MEAEGAPKECAEPPRHEATAADQIRERQREGNRTSPSRQAATDAAGRSLWCDDHRQSADVVRGLLGVDVARINEGHANALWRQQLT
jgi:hypothetical protein